MKLYCYYFHRKRFLLLLMSAVCLVIGVLQRHETFASYHRALELFPSFFAAMFCSFILRSDTENEFARCYGLSFARLGFSQWLPHVIYPLIAAVFCALLCSSVRDFSREGIRNSVLLCSIFITFLFLCSLMLCLRILLREPYITVGVYSAIFLPLFTFHQNLLLKATSIAYAKYDLWITGLLYSEDYEVSFEAWLVNRVGFLLGALFLLAFSILLMKQKNYENIR